MNNYIFVNRVKIYKFKVKDSDINTAILYLGNVLKDFSVDIWKRVDYTDMSVTFQLIIILLVLIIFWIIINI